MRALELFSHFLEKIFSRIKLNIVRRYYFLIIVFFFLLSSCGGRKAGEEEIDPRVQNAFSLIEKGTFDEAERILKEVKREKPDDCYASWGIFFVSLNKIISVINSVISTFSSFVQSGLSPRFSPKDVEEKNLSDFLAVLLFPILSPIEEISENAVIIDAKKCKVGISFPFILGSRTSPLTSSRLGELKGPKKMWGPTEAAFIGGFANIIGGVLKFLLTINFDIDLRKLLDIQARLDIGDILSLTSSPAPQDILGGISSQQISFLSSALSLDVYDPVIFWAQLAYVIDTSPDFLKLKPGSEHNIDDIAETLSTGLSLLSKFLQYIPQYSDERTIIGYRDIGKRGLSADDEIFLNIYSEEGEQGFFVKLGNLDLKLDAIIGSLFLKPLVNPELNKRISDFLSIFSKAIDINNPNIKEEERWVDLSLLSYAIPLLEIPPTIKFNPKNFLEGLKSTPEGLRAILPIWSDLNGDGFPEFVIEAESNRLEGKFCMKKEDRIQEFVLTPYIVVSELQGDKKRIRIVESRGSYEADFFCHVNHRIKSSEDRFSVAISSEMKVKKLRVNARSIEMKFDVSDCDSYDTTSQKYFVCYRIESGGFFGGGTYKPYVFIEDSFYTFDQILSDKLLSEKFSTKVIGTYTNYPEFVSTFTEGECTTHIWKRFLSYKSSDPDTFSITECPERSYSVENTSISSQAEIDINTCFYDFRWLHTVFPFYLSGDKFLPVLPDIYLSKKDFSSKDVQLVSVGRIIGDGEKASKYIIENISTAKLSQRYKLFVFFFTDPDIVRSLSIKNFPQNTFIVLGCSAALPRCFFGDDSPHFPSRVVHQGIVLDPRIKPDCMFPDGNWSYYYVAFKDPTFFNSIRVNIKNIGKMCGGDPDGWVVPDQYLINKVVADLLQRTISPIASVIARIIGIVTGTYQDILQGDACEF